MMGKFIIAPALFLSGISGVQAADVVVQEPVPKYNWSGLYVGAEAGYAWGKSTYDEPDFSTAYNMYYDPKGGFGGIYFGYNWQFENNLVLGGEADFYGGDIKGRSDYYIDHVPIGVGEVWGDAKLRWAGSVRARLGYAVDRFLPYVAGGVAFGQLKFGHMDTSANWEDGWDRSETHTGWTIGGGLEYAFTENLIGRLEYRYTDFGKRTIPLDYEKDLPTTHVSLKTNDVRLGIAYKF
ncbi:outer membrane protein [Pseudaminobacter soli (ex Li et al. 2025)]|uniref:Porin family protein n=1 Tax=Pseudaminobacter soli (ex Li et al. 2025) TaxID=1295366 RepID=A0A2P7SGG2_9HYPH|nr:outer membrane protein [Mesorhizobium soli]PSJ61578.1 porin family protein [Mesorhizobium soli]